MQSARTVGRQILQDRAMLFKGAALKVVLFLLLLLSTALVDQVAAQTRDMYQGPLLDAHSHTPPEPEKLEANIAPLMEKAGVTRIVLMGHRPQPGWPIGEDDRLTLQMYEAHPSLVIPFLNCIRWGYSMRDPAWMQYAGSQLTAGKFRGVGQLIIKRYVSHDPKDPDINKSTDLPWDSPFAQNLVRLTAKHNVPLMFMMESTPETLLALDRVLQQNPNSKLIWNHQNQLQDRIGPTPELRALSGDPQRIATLLEKYSNLHIDLTIGRDAIVRTASDRQIPEKWRDLYEKYSNRIIIGVDADTAKGFENHYLFEVGWIRGWLSQLGSDTAKKLAYENIERLITPVPATTTKSVAATTRTPTATQTGYPTRTQTATTIPSDIQMLGGSTMIAIAIAAAGIVTGVILLKRRRQ